MAKQGRLEEVAGRKPKGAPEDAGMILPFNLYSGTHHYVNIHLSIYYRFLHFSVYLYFNKKVTI
jgi:hypothetical protein